jgi:hypothetical protein
MVQRAERQAALLQERVNDLQSKLQVRATRDGSLRTMNKREILGVFLACIFMAVQKMGIRQMQVAIWCFGCFVHGVWTKISCGGLVQSKIWCFCWRQRIRDWGGMLPG